MGKHVTFFGKKKAIKGKNLPNHAHNHGKIVAKIVAKIIHLLIATFFLLAVRFKKRKKNGGGESGLRVNFNYC